MRIEDTTNRFSNTLALIVETFPYLEDDFFVKKLHAKIQVLISAYLKCGNTTEETSVAQYYLIEKLISNADEIVELLELINHLGKTKKTTPLLLANRGLLDLKLEFLKLKNSLVVSLHKKEASVPVIASKSDNKNQTAGINTVVVAQKNIRPIKELNPNKEKILNFIKKFPNTRTKDIIHEFNALSDRTVKRNLGELIRVGLINKKIENKAVYYSAEN